MTGRTYGQTRDCQGCRYWSEMLAMYAGETQGAMCLNPDSPDHMQYRREKHACAAWKSGHHGPVDNPGPQGYGALEQTLYEIEDEDAGLAAGTHYLAADGTVKPKEARRVAD